MKRPSPGPDDELPFVRIVWLDHASRPGWTSDEDHDDELPSCFTNGSVIKSTPETITVTSTFSSDGEYADPLTIHWGTVKELTFRTKIRTIRGEKFVRPRGL